MKVMGIMDEEQMAAFAGSLAQAMKPDGGSIFLKGELGAGKTTFARAMVRAAGYRGRVKSPTYGIVESYDTPLTKVHHFDLYRLEDPEELEFLGVREYVDGENLVLVEWPERAQGFLGVADIEVVFGFRPVDRSVTLIARSTRGEAWLAAADHL